MRKGSADRAFVPRSIGTRPTVPLGVGQRVHAAWGEVEYEENALERDHRQLRQTMQERALLRMHNPSAQSTEEWTPVGDMPHHNADRQPHVVPAENAQTDALITLLGEVQ